MGEPYVGEIRMFAGNFAPAGWALCQGQSMPISENETLFNLIGTTYGGDGQETFNLPNLSGRVPVHMGKGPAVSQTYQIGESAGVETVTLTTQQIPLHTHPLIASTAVSNSNTPTNQVTAQSAQRAIYFESAATTNLAASAISPVGGNQPHENMQPYLCINFIISLFGVFPSQT